MKTIRRRAATPVLRWKSVEPDQQYRVVLRNQDTGERQRIYDGFRTECRLPPDLRLTPDQLAFRVMVRPTDDHEGRFTRLLDYTPVPRLGDDFKTPADDLLVDDEFPGADQYRLLVRKVGLDHPLVDMVRPKPLFLLPPGQLRDGQFEYDIMVKVRGRWRSRKVLPVTAAMITAADERATRVIPLPVDVTKTIRGAPARHTPGRPDRLARQAHPTGPALLVAVDVTTRPDLSPLADSADIAARQWWAGDGTGAVESVALTLEANALKGFFFIDVLAAEVLGADLVRRLTNTLKKRGHGLGLLINSEPWRAVAGALAELNDVAMMALAHARYESIIGEAAAALSFGPGLLNEDTLAEARRLGVKVVLADRVEQLGLPAWMRWRTAPFAAYDDLLVIPAAMALSTPAHKRDRVVRHALNAVDAMAADAASDLLAAAAITSRDSLITARIEPLELLRKSTIRSRTQAEAWNLVLAERLPAWAEAGWERSPHGFTILADRDEIKVEMMTALVAGLRRAEVTAINPQSALEPGHLRAWAEAPDAFDPLVEQRRGPRRFRRSAVRRYDAAFLQALKATPA
ncbi:MAG: hypothetical protein ACK4Y4_06375 [Brevundimonas sp.]